MKTIPLTQGRVALVDDEDFEMLSQWKWSGVRDVHRFDSPGHSPRLHSMHRFIMGAGPGVEVDHINGNPLDNRRCNLRLCTSSQNGANQGIGSRNSSGFKGVSWSAARRKWQAHIKVRRVSTYLGLFLLAEDAAAAYDSAARVHFGEFARLNFPDEGEAGA
jgi:hypothetical protein